MQVDFDYNLPTSRLREHRQVLGTLPLILMTSSRELMLFKSCKMGIKVLHLCRPKGIDLLKP